MFATFSIQSWPTGTKAASSSGHCICNVDKFYATRDAS